MKIPESVRELIASGALAHLTTINSKGGPQVTVVWVGIQNEEFVIGHLASRPPGPSSESQMGCSRRRRRGRVRRALL